MKLRILGSASGDPVLHRHASAVRIDSGTLQLLVDAGDGVARQFVRYHIDPCTLDAVIISHTHPDHAGGLFMLLQRMYIAKRSQSLKIFLPGGLLPGFHNIFPYFNIFTERWPFQFELNPIESGIFFEDRGFRAEAVLNGHVAHYQEFASRHGIQAEAFSFSFSDTNGKKMIYTADIDRIDRLTSIADGTQLLLSECTHVDPEEVIRFAVHHQIGRVVFTHIDPDLEGAVRRLQSDQTDVRVTRDGEIIEL